LVVLIFLRQILKPLAEEIEVLQTARVERGGVGRSHAHDGLYKAGHLEHRLAIFVIGFGVESRVTGNFAPCLRMIVYPPEVITTRHRREGAVQRKNLQSMSR